MSNTKVACRSTDTDTFTSNGVDLSTSAGLCCYVDTNGKITKASDATTGPLYIIVQAGGSETNSEVTVCLSGKCFVKAGASGFGEGADLTSDTNGEVIATTTADDYTVAYAKHAASDGDEVEINVSPNRYSVD